MTPEEFRNKYDNLTYKKYFVTVKEFAKLIAPNAESPPTSMKDQYRGRVSIDCPQCDFHETVNVIEMRRTANRN